MLLFSYSNFRYVLWIFNTNIVCFLHIYSIISDIHFIKNPLLCFITKLYLLFLIFYFINIDFLSNYIYISTFISNIIHTNILINIYIGKIFLSISFYYSSLFILIFYPTVLFISLESYLLLLLFFILLYLLKYATFLIFY